MFFGNLALYNEVLKKRNCAHHDKAETLMVKIVHLQSVNLFKKISFTNHKATSL